MDASWRHVFLEFTSPNMPSIAVLTAVQVGIYVLWLVAAWAIYAATLGPVQPDAWVIFPNSFAAFFNELFTTPAGWAMIIVGNLVGLAFALVVLAISVVSFPMVRSEEHTSELQSLMRISYAVFCLKKKI